MTRELVARTVILCAWCAHYGQPHGAARATARAAWRAIPYEQAAALHAAGPASHGLCPWCRPLLAAEWNVPLALHPLQQRMQPVAASGAHHHS